jgi:hypothetical protein
MKIDMSSDFKRCAIRLALFEVFGHERAPEGIELFKWRHVPVSLNFLGEPAPLTVPVQGEGGFVDEVEVQTQIRGQLGYLHPIDGDIEVVFWAGWDKDERVGVIACGENYLFPGDPRH